MLVQDFIVIERPRHEVLEALGEDVAGLLAESTSAAARAAEQLRARVGPALPAPLAMRKAVTVEIGPTRQAADSVLIAFSWKVEGGLSGVFPRLDADLEVAPLGAASTELTVRGRYEPPGGPLGRQLDRLVMHRVAESTVRAFLVHLAGRLQQRVPGVPAGPQPSN